MNKVTNLKRIAQSYTVNETKDMPARISQLLLATGAKVWLNAAWQLTAAAFSRHNYRLYDRFILQHRIPVVHDL